MCGEAVQQRRARGGLGDGYQAFPGNQVRDASSDASFSLHAVPGSDDTSATRMAGAASATYAVNANAENKDAAIAFMDFLASPEGTNPFADVQAGLPAIPNDDFELDPALEEFAGYVNDGKTYPFMDQLWPNPDVQNAHLTGLQGYFDGSESMEDVLNSMDEAWAQGPA